MKELHIFVTYHLCDITYRHVTSGQEFAAFFHADFLDIFPESHACFLFETAADVGEVVVLLLAEFLQVNGFLILSAFQNIKDRPMRALMAIRAEDHIVVNCTQSLNDHVRTGHMIATMIDDVRLFDSGDDERSAYF